VENSELLRTKALAGLEERGLSGKQEYVDRLEYELETIEKLGFTTYFLVMCDIVRFARENDILYGPGRGSGAGSLLNYCLKITLIDPLKYGLHFERFLNPNRVSPPDIDWDTADRGRIIEYLEGKYGKDRVARVGTVNFLRTKSAIRDIGRVLEKEFKFIDNLAELVPPPVAGLWDSFDREAEVEPELLSSRYQEIIDPTRKLWGVLRSYGTHAGGVAIAPIPISEMAPLYKDKDGNPVSQFDWRDLEKAGLLKFDILGLNTLEVIQLTLKYLKVDAIDLDLESLEDGDPDAYKMICSGDLDGVFQLGGSESIKQLTVSMSPKCIEDLALVTSLYRPGPLSSGMVDGAVRVKQGKATPKYIDPILAPILDVTHGVPVFQEQIMNICTDLCGYTLPEADKMRKIVGKKLKKEMPKQKKMFVEGAIANGVPRSGAEKLFGQIEDYAQYLFNKTHAVAYSVITYWTAYLKAHHPIAFYASLLACEKHPDKRTQYASTIKTAGIDILPPDVNLSGFYHQPEGNAIRFGLSHIKGMATATAQEIVDLRND